ncbi:general secretion pathway protein GspB [Vibrio europaeus]|uniref:general secretion pathway protein GspB n=1 Tax=Vibrio europaeus TaxID=300876 RepID=UPI00233EA6F9|nr:general secretion pathway protein GspB [Vibrio europaeus]MDC5807733.1 general secretion pathway protein GspB [Vibrio europaeus]MDC5824467.1 general secretion pathway protein GspB [Vibrio europaeus]MDC5828089.1 general secretion pathway protein GspB [Vibrio europaeus]MDC5836216.1 general secretion pathway protein GspB [Vibrio europaeus]MDC5850597.1 general secretion pathway protein GspB [Vibrio europaeus]
MSKVMQALEHSERSHQNLSSFYQAPAHAVVQQKEARRGRYIAFALIPPLFVAGIMAFQTYQAESQRWLEHNVAETVLVEVPFEYTASHAPDFGFLAVTYRDNRSSAQSDWLNQIEQDTNLLPQEVLEQASTVDSHVDGNTTESHVSESSDDLLSGLDLSQLSPELAQRFESALSSNAKPESNRQNSEASNLSQQAERWYGKLPALNFQTHVYSSKPSKRWVKINGVEYNQGDWVSDNIELVAIEQQSCLIRFNGELIEVPALYDWQG